MPFRLHVDALAAWKRAGLTAIWRGVRVARELDAMIRLYGKPAAIVSDNDTEFTSRAMLEWQSRETMAGQTRRPAHYPPASDQLNEEKTPASR